MTSTTRDQEEEDDRGQEGREKEEAARATAVTAKSEEEDTATTQTHQHQQTTTTTQEKKEEETLTIAALDGMDAKDWAGARDRLVAALAVDGQFVPAVLLIRALRLARPSVFKQGDITIKEAERRIRGTSTEAKKRGKRFVESLASSSPSQPSSTSGSRMFLMGHWNDWIEGDLAEAVK
jgi:hypothetical protein